MRIRLEPQQHELKNGRSIRRCKIIRLEDNEISKETEIWFQLDQSVPLPDEDDCDAYLLAVVMEAMAENREIEVKGSVSKQLLSNLVEFQAAWNKWKPSVYSCVEISAEKEVDKTEKVAGAICAFSGGVDATFSVWRHTQSKNSHRSQKINVCSIVHGFDIPLYDTGAFENATNRARNTLSDVGVKLMPIKTNYRQFSNVDWMDAFSIAIVASLSNFKNMAGTCIIGSNEPYDSLIIPLGSSPLTDHLLSSDQFVVIHDGASHSRTEKVKEITDWKMGVDNLRVCWEGDLNDQNCGVCEKCIRTKLNFLAVGSPIPSCFPVTDDFLENLDQVQLRNDAVRAEWRQIYEIAIKNKVQGDWVHKVDKIAKKGSYPLLNSLFPRGSSGREILKKVLCR